MDDGQIHYTPLSHGEIRLVDLAPAADRNAPITLRLLHCAQASAPPYDALSYVWGDQTTSVPINCNANPTSIAPNLHWALQRARDTHEPRFLWADALCINQRDGAERSAQVAMMGAIFAAAHRVLICVGEPPAPGGGGGGDDDDDAHVAALVNGIVAQWGRLRAFPRLGAAHPLRSDARWHSFARFMRQPWFRRGWVIQEAGVAADPWVLYGACEFRYRDMLRVLTWQRGDVWSDQFSIPSLLVHREWADWSADPGPMGFIDLLNHGALLECSDPRDYIYSFLGHPLARDEQGEPFIMPDYEKTVGQVFLDVSCLLLRRFGLRMLSSVEHREDTIVDEAIPSWVVRWNVSIVVNDLSRFPYSRYRATPPLWAPDVSNIIVEGMRLELPGVLLDTVARSFQIDVPATPDAPLHFTDTSTMRILDWSGLQAEYPRSMAAMLKTLCARDDLNLWTRLQIPEDKQDFENEVRAVSIGRCLVVTLNGGFGLAPLITRPGDVCALLYGADVPFMLRPASADGPGYRLLGEAFVHSVMHGEIEAMLRRGQVAQQTMVIA